MEEVTEASESSGIPSPVEKSPFDFADEDPFPVILEGVGTGGQARDEVLHEIPLAGNPLTTEVALDLELEAAAIGSLVRKRRRERCSDGANANTAPKVLRKDHASIRSKQSTHRGKSLTSMELAAGSNFVTPTDTKSVSDPDPLSYAEPQPFSEKEIAQSSEIPTEIVATAEVQNLHSAGSSESGKSISISSMVESPKGRYNINLAQQVTMGSQLRLRFEQETMEEDVHGLRNRTKNLETLMEAEVDMKRVAELSQQVSNLQAQVTGEEKIKVAFEDFKKYKDDKVEQRCAEMDARLDALSIDFNEELYPHMLTMIASHRWVIGHGIRLAVIKCAESTKLRKVFANVVSTGIAKGMSEGLKHGVEQEKAKLDLATIEAYDPEDAPIDLIMASLHLESDVGEDTPQWVRDLCPSSQLKISVYPKVSDPRNPWAFKEKILLKDAIAANISRVEKKKCQVV
ncbi:hypothetical protein Tco_0563342 [Tanacetum coccineum]